MVALRDRVKLPRLYAADRDEAFVAFVGDGDFAHIDALTSKWGLQSIPHSDVGAASIYKAVQECTRIPADVKAAAAGKCAALGFSPQTRWG